MSGARTLRIDAGFCTRTGPRPSNQDFVALHDGTANAVHSHVLAIADGVSAGPGGRTAAELAVRSFIEAHDGGSPTQGIARNAARAMAAFNAWLHAMAATDARLRNAATTFTAAVLAGRELQVIHVGDSRAYLLHGNELTCLTRDHTMQQPERQHVLLRAIGLEPGLRLDHGRHALRAHDRVLLCTDGVHGVLGDAQLHALLRRRRAPGEDAAAIVQAALDAGSQDNATCAIADVLEVPPVGVGEVFQQMSSLPLRAPPSVGECLDGFRIQGRLAGGRASHLLRATDEVSGEEVVLKFPQAAAAGDTATCQAFMREAWVAARVHSPWISEIIELPEGRQTCLYSVMPWYDGETLEQRLCRAPPVTLAEGVDIARKLTRAVAALHRANIIHRDLKPDNVLIDAQGGLRLIDLGVARLPMLEDLPGPDIPGTPSFMAPELFDAQPGDEASDQFALGVTLYRLFTARYPYGEVEPFMRPRFSRQVPLSQHRPDLPAWLGHLIARATAVERNARYGDVLELLMELDSGMERGVPVDLRPLSLYERHPLRFWQAVSALLMVLLIGSFAF